MDRVQVMPGLLSGLEAGEVGRHHCTVAIDGEDQRDIDRNTFGENRRDGGQTGQRGRNLDQQIGPINDFPQLDRLQDRLIGVVRQPRVDLDRDPAVDAIGGLPLRPKHIAGLSDVVRGGGADGGVDVGAPRGEFSDLRGIRGARRECSLEYRRVGRDADNTLGVDEFLQIA